MSLRKARGLPASASSRQKLLAVTSAVVVIGGIAWWVVQQQLGTPKPAALGAVQAGPTASGKLHIVLVPAHSNIHVGQVLTVSAEVYNSLGQQLGPGECELKWSDALSGWKATTACIMPALPAATASG